MKRMLWPVVGTLVALAVVALFPPAARMIDNQPRSVGFEFIAGDAFSSRGNHIRLGQWLTEMAVVLVLGGLAAVATMLIETDKPKPAADPTQPPPLPPLLRGGH